MLNILDIIFNAGLIVYGVAILLRLVSSMTKKDGISQISWGVYLLATAIHLAYFISRAMISGRLPLSNQFEFAMSFSLGISLIYIVLILKFKANWIAPYATLAAFLMLCYAASLPKEIRELMPALRSQWFALHIGAAVISYSSFVLSGCAGVKYLLDLKKGEPEDGVHLRQIDFFSYRLVALGILMLTVVILSGAVWAEEAWSSFWSWDPKELWSLITWIIYAIYLHQRLRKNWQGKRMAIFSIVNVGVVLFTFIGVNVLLPGLHSYR
ncbi:MAG: c-type cytochrome biogenesis protein CcsB [Oscillospiraceae bacterium]|nr:c-type cytochrome biogenesis protein CcsB [Oscillospiraceae bacterium]